MDQSDELIKLGARAWEFRRQMGFSKSLPEDIRIGAAELAKAGVSGAALSKALGVARNTIVEWTKKYSKESEKPSSFKEVAIVETRPSFEVKIIGEIQGCRVEITGSDFALIQRLFKRL
jgi:hypothetical protein